MKFFNLLSMVLILALILTSCGDYGSLRSNPFESKFPIAKCSRKIDVADPEPVLELGKFISPQKGIYLLTPYVRLSSTYLTTGQDSVYLDKMTDYLGNRIENQFLQLDWIEGVVPANLANLSADTTGVPPSVAEMVTGVLERDTIDYRNWNVPADLLLPNSDQYTLLFFINGIIGFDDMTENENYFYFFLIDNEARKVSYADFFKYRCDVRNTNGLRKVLDYGYLKLLDVRFPEGRENTD